MRKQLGGATIAAAAFLLWSAVSPGQDVRPTPGPGTGIVTVKGTVDIGVMPDVRALQEGEWKVALVNTPNVRVVATAPLDFVKQGRRYRVTWLAGESEDIVVAQLGSGGWTRVESSTRRSRWINLDEARGVEEL